MGPSAIRPFSITGPRSPDKAGVKWAADVGDQERGVYVFVCVCVCVCVGVWNEVCVSYIHVSLCV